MNPVAVRYRAAVEAEDGDALEALYRSDVVLDAHVPNWRFAVHGDRSVAKTTIVMPRPGRFDTFEVEEIHDGVLVQLAWRQHGPAGGAVCRQLHVWRLVEDRIGDQLVFCAGVWDRALQADMAARAPRAQP